MNRSNTYVGIALVLIVLGLMLLLQNLGILPFAGGLIFGMLFGLGGLAFLTVFVGNREQWWALIPGVTLLGLAGLILLSTLFPNGPEGLFGGMFLGAIGLSFWLIFLFHPCNWWAVIPGGVLVTLALVAAASELTNGFAAGSLFFLGLAATFGLLYVLPTEQGRMRWAAWPAGASAAMAVFVFAFTPGIFNWIWPIALIGAGAFLALRAFAIRQA